MSCDRCPRCLETSHAGDGGESNPHRHRRRRGAAVADRTHQRHRPDRPGCGSRPLLLGCSSVASHGPAWFSWFDPSRPPASRPLGGRLAYRSSVGQLIGSHALEGPTNNSARLRWCESQRRSTQAACNGTHEPFAYSARSKTRLTRSPAKRVLCRGPESNWRHMVLQTIALPTELPRRGTSFYRNSGRSRPSFVLTDLEPGAMV